MALTATDHAMIHHAIARGVVAVERDGETRLATLIAWRPHRHGKRTKRARVQFAPGRYASVPIEKVSVP